MNQVQKMLDENLVLRLWPQTGKTVLGMSRGATYAAAEKGDIKTVRVGRLSWCPPPGSRRSSKSTKPPRELVTRHPTDGPAAGKKNAGPRLRAAPARKTSRCLR